jgi:hypothetical protein
MRMNLGRRLWQEFGIPYEATMADVERLFYLDGAGAEADG